jgi:hypothetical protein
MPGPPIVDHFLKQYSFLLRLSPEEVHWVGTRVRFPRFTYDQIEALFEAAEAVLATNCTSVLDINTSAWVVGDIHGNIHDLLRILASVGDLHETPVVFLGDYVDRGG